MRCREIMETPCELSCCSTNSEGPQPAGLTRCLWSPACVGGPGVELSYCSPSSCLPSWLLCGCLPALQAKSRKLCESSSQPSIFSCRVSCVNGSHFGMGMSPAPVNSSLLGVKPSSCVTEAPAGGRPVLANVRKLSN